MSHRKNSYAAFIGAAALALALIGATASTTTAVAEARPFHNARGESIADVTSRVLPSVVSIATKSVAKLDQSAMRHFGRGQRGFGQGVPRRGLGSGVIVSSEGYILTNNHVVDRAETIRVKLADGRETTATVVGTDPKSDLAVLRLKKNLKGLKPIPMGSSAKMRLGDVVLAIGNPMGVGQSVTMGIVSAKGRANMGIVDYEDFIQTDAAINPGNSGGALVNLNGELVGINTAILSRSGGNQGIGFAIPSDMARPIMRMLIKSGKVTRGYLGVSIQKVNDELAQALRLKVPGNRGVLVADVMGGTPAARAGLKRNDVVIRLNGKKMHETSGFRNAIATEGYGRIVNLEVVRNGHRLQIPVKLGKLPEDQGRIARRSKKSGKSSFGVHVTPVDRRSRNRWNLPNEIRSGVIIAEVRPGSRADTLGIKKGDVIIEVNRRTVSSANDFLRAYKAAKRKLALLVYRDGMTSYIIVTK